MLGTIQVAQTDRLPITLGYGLIMSESDGVSYNTGSTAGLVMESYHKSSNHSTVERGALVMYIIA